MMLSLTIAEYTETGDLSATYVASNSEPESANSSTTSGRNKDARVGRKGDGHGGRMKNETAGRKEGGDAGKSVGRVDVIVSLSGFCFFVPWFSLRDGDLVDGQKELRGKETGS